MINALEREVGALDIEALKQRYLTKESTFLNVEGMQVHYRDVNIAPDSAPVLILLHGIFSSLHTWDAWTDLLSNHFRIISIDTPNFGLTGAHPLGMKTYLYSDFLNSFLTALNIQKIHLAGSSLGGWMSWEFAARFPEKVQKLILIDSAGFFFVPPAILISMGMPLGGWLSTKIRIPRKLVYSQVRSTYFDPHKLSKDTLSRHYDLFLLRGNRQAAARVIRYLRNHLGFPSRLLQQIDCPTLIMWGSNDRWIPIEHTQKFKHHIKDSKIKIYENCGHLPMEELPNDSANDALIFLNS